MTKLEFTQKYNDLYGLMYAFALRLTNDSSSANDLMQEASYKAYKSRATFRQGTNFKAWLSTILRNTFINNYRKRKVRKVVSESAENLTYQFDKRFQANNQGESNLYLEEINRLFAKIDDKYSIPFLMSYQGYMYDEIAESLGVPVGTVKSRIHTARVKLRAMLSN
ncbi:MAG: RNA polymerase sigma factor [Bacteroidota bacterium]